MSKNTRDRLDGCDIYNWEKPDCKPHLRFTLNNFTKCITRHQIFTPKRALVCFKRDEGTYHKHCQIQYMHLYDNPKKRWKWLSHELYDSLYSLRNELGSSECKHVQFFMHVSWAFTYACLRVHAFVCMPKSAWIRMCSCLSVCAWIRTCSCLSAHAQVHAHACEQAHLLVSVKSKYEIQ